MINWKGIILGVILGLLLAFGSVASWFEFVHRIAPHLNQREAGDAAILGFIAILCLSSMVAITVWIVKTHGHLPVSVIFKKGPVSPDDGKL
jgi:hypothetical protein